MKTYRLNIEGSRKLLSKHKEHIKPKDCYTNIYRVVMEKRDRDILKDMISGKCRVAYGFTQLDENSNIYYRHCFLIHNNNVIDPTLALRATMPNVEYIVIESYDVDEYIEALSKEMQTGLFNYLFDKGYKLEQKLWENGCICIG